MSSQGPTEPAAPAPPSAAPSTAAQSIDLAINQRFWQERVAGMDPADPRVVTLDTESQASVAREVQLYQRWLLRRLDQRRAATGTVYDLGCGNGDWTVVLAGRYDRTIAVDLTEGLLAATRARLEREAPGKAIATVCSDIAAVPLDEPSDLIVLGAVTQYLGDDQIATVLQRAAASLRPRRGVLYLRSTVAKNAERRARKTDDYQAIYRSPRWYLDAIAAAGFVVEEWQLATDFVTDELSRRWLGPAGPVLG